VPAVIQDATTDAVLMVGFMNDAALAATRSTDRVHFWSRSRGQLWKKGETSGHEQIVKAIHVNCEQNSLLLQVQQIGAVCHDGYDTCFYRRLETDDILHVEGERMFDPAAVYRHDQPATGFTTVSTPLETSAAHTLYRAFAFLRDTDATDLSRTSRLLRQDDDAVQYRVADELRELAGVLDGTHRHGDARADLLLEGSQVLYWVILSALRADVNWADIRLDRALATADEAMTPAAVVNLLRAEAERWTSPSPTERDHGATCHATVALVSQACGAGGVDSGELIQHELHALRQKPYMTPFFGER
jgi:phosphoribosyl-AMP cyclohydrolase